MAEERSRSPSSDSGNDDDGLWLHVAEGDRIGIDEPGQPEARDPDSGNEEDKHPFAREIRDGTVQVEEVEPGRRRLVRRYEGDSEDEFEGPVNGPHFKPLRRHQQLKQQLKRQRRVRPRLREIRAAAKKLEVGTAVDAARSTANSVQDGALGAAGAAEADLNQPGSSGSQTQKKKKKKKQSLSRKVCWNCREPGHEQKNCRVPEKRICNMCFQPYHLAKDCPNMRFPRPDPMTEREYREAAWFEMKMRKDAHRFTKLDYAAVLIPSSVRRANRLRGNKPG